MTRKLKLDIHDTSLGIWQNDANDPTFRAEIYGGLIRLLRNRGWSVKPDPRIKERFAALSPSHRLASKGSMRASIEIGGRVATFEAWATTWAIDNQNGRRYDFNKLERMTYLDQKRFALETQAIMQWLSAIAEVSPVRTQTKNLTADERIAKEYAESWRTDLARGRPVCAHDSNRKSKDGALIEHGQTVWFVGHDGRVRRGQAFYNINNMWWIKLSKHELMNLASHDIFTAQPADLRSKRNERKRRAKLEHLLSCAVAACDFRRAQTLHRILFGDEPTYRIWSRDKNAYYAVNCSGYSADTIRAGLYTRNEAETEARRAAHILSLVTPEGEHIRFDQAATAA